jgi:hypothetical protein
MPLLKWIPDEITRHWASKAPLPLGPVKHPQFDGTGKKMCESSWVKHILKNSFPSVCRHKDQPGCLSYSPESIISCFKDGNYLEALALVVRWGAMTRTKNSIYREDLTLERIFSTFETSRHSILSTDSIEASWPLFTDSSGGLGWSKVITSKSLHFFARSLGYENPPVPIDNKVIINVVWPTFLKMIKENRRWGDPALPLDWQDNSWKSFNRYMTAIECWASHMGWSFTALENTLFSVYYPK